MPLPLILAALASAGTAAGGAGALTGLGAGMAGQGALASLAGQGGFLGGAPFGAAGFMGNSASSALPGLMGSTATSLPMNRNTLLQGLAKDLMKGGGGVNVPYVRRDQPQGGLMNQGSRRG